MRLLPSSFVSVHYLETSTNLSYIKLTGFLDDHKGNSIIGQRYTGLLDKWLQKHGYFSIDSLRKAGAGRSVVILCAE
jgi:hypothetical protein